MRKLTEEERYFLGVTRLWWKSSSGYFLTDKICTDFQKDGLIRVGKYFGATKDGDVYISDIPFYKSEHLEPQLMELTKKIGAYEALAFIEL